MRVTPVSAAHDLDPRATAALPSGSPAGVVYLVTNTVNGKEYVGYTTTSCARRWIQHCSSARKGSCLALHAAIRKYGEHSFTRSILEEVANVSALKDAERRHIEIRDCTAPCGYNLTLGGDGVDYQVPGVRERHAAAVVRTSADPRWRDAVRRGIVKRQENPEYRKRQATGARKAGLLRRSPNCTQCGTLLTAENVAGRSWCKPCNRRYHRAYRLQRKQA